MSGEPALRVRFTIEGQPQRWQRTRHDGRSGRFFKQKDNQAAHDHIAAMARVMMRGRPPFEGPVVVVYNCFRKIPKSYTKIKAAACLSGSLRPTSVPDLDNYVKLVLDAANNIIYKDDAQVVDMIVRKWFGNPPRLTVSFNDWIGK